MNRLPAIFCLLSLVAALSAADASVPTELVMIRGSRQACGAVVVLEFSGPVAHGPLTATGHGWQVHLPGIVTSLKPLRRYHSFDGWLRIDPVPDGLNIVFGPPAGYAPARIERRQNPERLVICAAAPRPRSAPPARVAVSATAEPVAPTAPRPGPPMPPIDASGGRRDAQRSGLDYIGPTRQMDQIRARILSRLGQVPRSLTTYRDLRQRYPEDPEIWIDYAETLVDEGFFEMATAELEMLRRRRPDDLRAQRLQARLQVLKGRPDRAVPVLARLSQQYPQDVGIWSDYAQAQLADGRWAAALNHYSRVLEIDPDNLEARRRVHEILQNHRPWLETGFQTYRQHSGDVTQTTIATAYGRHLTEATRLELQTRQVTVRRPAQPGLAAIERQMAEINAQLGCRIDGRWQIDLGGDLYQGLGDGAGLRAAAALRIGDQAWLQGAYLSRRPWYDPSAAASMDGRYAEGRLALDWPLDDGWALSLAAARRDYRLLAADGATQRDYGRQRTLTMAVNRRLAERPDLTIGYGFYRSLFDYDDPSDTPVDMLASEAVHSLAATFEHWPCTYWGLRLASGLLWDAVREVDSWYLAPGLRFRLGNRIRIDLDYHYSSEAGNAAGGTTDTFNAQARVVF